MGRWDITGKYQMKKASTLIVVMICMAMALCVSCKKDDDKSDGGGNTVATVTTEEVTDITQTTAMCGGEVKSENGWAVTERGVCWSTNQNPTPSDNCTVDGEGVGKFTSEITGLEPGTKYYVRAYAINAAGTSFGSEKNFTTQSGGGGTVHTVPTVTTNEVTEITETSAVCGGFVVSDCGAAVTARGVCWSTSPNPTISCQHTTDGNGTGYFTSNITGLTANTTYYVMAYATNSAGTGYGEQKSFTTQSGGGSGGGIIAGHEYVDLGLPSGLLWATCNIGANSPEDDGYHYAWGETTTKNDYDEETYKWYDPWDILKYNTDPDYGPVDNKTVLELADDAAHVKWGGSWRMPTADEMNELITVCSWTWTMQSGVNVRKATGPNGNSIFLPVAGYDNENGHYSVCGGYWSSSLVDDDPPYAWALGFCSDDVIKPGVYDEERYVGLSVRPVSSPQK